MMADLFSVSRASVDPALKGLTYYWVEGFLNGDIEEYRVGEAKDGSS